MREAASPDKPAVLPVPSLRRLVNRIRIRYLLIPVLLLVGLLVMPGLPWLLWAYNVEQAGRNMDVGLAWPQPRLVDSLPARRNDAALQSALNYLAAAIRWRPQHAYAYRLTGQIYAARQDWLKAAASFDRAQALSSGNPLPAWESALVYEQMWRIVRTTPGETIMPDLGSAPIVAPQTPIPTRFCRKGRPQTCYVGLDQWTQPYAALPDGPALGFDTLFMHPPAAVRLTRPIYADHPVLYFLLGLDPQKRASAVGSATFRVEVESANGASRRVYERTIDGATAKRGWVPGSVDLSAWAGQTVTLVFSTSSASGANPVDDWYGWGNVILTTREAAQYAMLAPEARTRQAWQAVGFDSAKFVTLGDQAWQQGRVRQGLAWYQRAGIEESKRPLAVRFRLALGAIVDTHVLPTSAPEGIETHPLASSAQIEAKSLQWDWGESLSAYPSADPRLGVLWWGNAAVAVLRVPEAGTYRVTLRAQNTPPAPTKLQFEQDFTPVAQFTLQREDLTWQEFGTDLFFTRGIHVIGIRCLNTGWDRNIKRNAVLDWIRLQRKS